MNEGEILPAASRIPQAWRNGGGVTREVAASGVGPDGSFDWRVSMAEVQSAGPFSIFPGIDRTLCVLSGGLSLDIEGQTKRLQVWSAPFAFPGDVNAFGAPLGGAVLDLNIMTKRGGWTAEVSRLRGDGSVPAADTIIMIATGPASINGRDVAYFDAFMINNPSSPVDFFSHKPIYAVRLLSV